MAGRALGRVRGRIYNPLRTDVTRDEDEERSSASIVVDDTGLDGINMIEDNNEDNNNMERNIEDNESFVNEGENSNSNNGNINNHRSVLRGARTALQQRLRERQERQQQRRQQYSRIGDNNGEDDAGSDVAVADADANGNADVRANVRANVHAKANADVTAVVNAHGNSKYYDSKYNDKGNDADADHDHPLSDVSLTVMAVDDKGKKNPTSGTTKENSDDTKKVDESDTDTNSDSDSAEKRKLVDGITVVILDPMQQRFSVSVSPRWTVSEVKACSEKVHKVPPLQQRLIYRGKLLSDNDTLEECNITQSDLIIHLFPKPRVVVTSHNNDNGAANATQDQDDEGNGSEGNGAHVPEIILDADEAERRSSILVLGSPYFVEAQNNVKLLAFLLLVITSIDLLNLFTIFMGVPADQEGDFTGNSNGAYDDSIWGPTNYEDGHSENNNGNNSTNTPQASDADEEFIQWTFSDNFDFIISSVGFYVALLGIQATNENTLRLAKKYMYGTFVVGVAWMIFNYISTAQALQTQEEEEEFGREFGHDGAMTLSPSSESTFNGNSSSDENHENNSYDTEDYYAQSIQYMILPGMVWLLCCVRAWQFHYLLQEAETEAQHRIRNELDLHNNYIQGGQGNDDGSYSHDNDNDNDNNSTDNNNDDLEQGPRRMMNNPPLPLPMIS